MAPARGRAPKAAAGNSANAKTKVEKAPEVEEGSDQEMEESPVEQKKMVGKGRKLKETKEDAGAEEDLPKAKRGRKTKVQEDKADEDEKKAVGKGKKKEEESAVEEDTKKEPLRGKKTATAVKDENDDDEEIAMKPKKGGKKPALKEDEKDKEAEKKPSARGRKKLAAKEENVEEADEEEHTKPAAAKRGKKPTNVKSAGGENGAANNGDSAAKPAKSRKKNTAEVAALPEVDEEENSSPEDDEAPAKPVAKRGKKPAAPGPSEEKNGAVDEDEAPAKPAAKRGRKVAAAAAREVSEEKNGSAEEGEAGKLAPKRMRKPVLTAPQDDDEDNEPEKPKRVRKTGAAAKNSKAAEPPVKKTKAEAKAPKNKVDTNLEEIDFTCEKENPKGEKPNFKIVSWNVGGARAVVKKKGIEYLLKEDADVIVMQETKATEEQMNDAIELPGYKFYYVDSEEAGYAGAALYSKKEPVNVTYGIENSKCNNEGRLITAEFENFYILNVYVPNAGRKLVTMDKRLEWNKEFKAYVKQLDAKKPVFVCGDMNVAHQEIDLSNPKTNTKNAGFTKEERDGLTDFLAAGFVDTYRHLYPEKSDAYTFWSYMSNARAKNVGWRLDYFIVSERLKENICDNVMRSGVFGSDHCPVVLFANV